MCYFFINTFEKTELNRNDVQKKQPITGQEVSVYLRVGILKQQVDVLKRKKFS